MPPPCRPVASAPTAPSLSAQAPVRRASTAACHVSQVEALRAAMNPGLTLVVGPPGTGKTDTAVQIVSNIAHTFSSQRTLIITHSNQARTMVHSACALRAPSYSRPSPQALNDVFEKLMVRDIDERYMLRLGHGEELLETEKARIGSASHFISA